MIAAVDAVIGAGWAPIRVRRIEGRLLITALTDSSAERAGARVGDELLRVDGAPAESLFARTRALTAASTPWSLEDRTAMQFLNGVLGATFTATVRDAAGRVRDVRLVRKREDYTTLYHRERDGAVVRRLPVCPDWLDPKGVYEGDIDPSSQDFHELRIRLFCPHDPELTLLVEETILEEVD